MSVPFPLTPEDATFVFVLIPINSVALSAVLSYLLPNGFQISFFFFSRNTGFDRGESGQAEWDGYRVTMESGGGEDKSGLWKEGLQNHETRSPRPPRLLLKFLNPALSSLPLFLSSSLPPFSPSLLFFF